MQKVPTCLSCDLDLLAHSQHLSTHVSANSHHVVTSRSNLNRLPSFHFEFSPSPTRGVMMRRNKSFMLVITDSLVCVKRCAQTKHTRLSNGVQVRCVFATFAISGPSFLSWTNHFEIVHILRQQQQCIAVFQQSFSQLYVLIAHLLTDDRTRCTLEEPLGHRCCLAALSTHAGKMLHASK